jgi:hypothetical protein
MIEDKATEKLKKRLKEIGLIVNMGADKARPKPIGTSDRVNLKPGKKASKK